MNCYFDEQVITSKVDKSRNVKFNINEKFKKIYIMIKDSVYLPVDVCNETVEFTDDNTYGICSKRILEEKNDINNPTEEEDDNIDINNSIFSSEIEDPSGLDYGLH